MRITARTSRRTTATFCALVAMTAAASSVASPAAAKNCHATKTCATTTTNAVTTSTGPGTTTTQPSTTTTTQPSTTTTTIGGDQAATYAGAFLSYPHQSGRQSITGNDLNIGMRSYVGFKQGACLTVHDAHNVYLHDLDFDTCSGGIFLLNVTGTIRIEYVRGRNIGNGSIGLGQGNLIQFNNAWQSAPEILPGGYARIVHIKEYGGDTEDVISVFKSGGIDASHPLVIGDVHVESPLPPNALAWSSTTGTCVNLADAGGHDIRLQNSTFLNCGQVGIQMNEPAARVIAKANVLYGAQRASSNVGLSQWASTTCSGSCPGNAYNGNRVWWVKGNGAASDLWLSGTYPVSTSGNTLHDATIDPATLKVVL